MDLQRRAEELLGRPLGGLKVFRDTSNFMTIDVGSVVDLEGRLFLIRGMEFEGRFGLDDQPKHWVKRALDMDSGQAKILKLVFHEEFNMPLGHYFVHCYRSAEKEGRILDMVRGHPGFMQGENLLDKAGNLVRVLDRIPGQSLDAYVETLESDGHQDYCRRLLPGLLLRLREAMEAIAFLHNQDERHGDIRRDHLLVPRGGGPWCWIDFDYTYELRQNPFGLDLFGLGNVLNFLVARGTPTKHELTKKRPELLKAIEPGDYSLVIRNRIFNLKKLYPYLPESLNRVLMHFAVSSEVFYESVEEIMVHLRVVQKDLWGAS